MLTPTTTYIALLVVQTFHLSHHRVAKRHISFAEVLSADVARIMREIKGLLPAVATA
jgi:hypothetical protein